MMKVNPDDNAEKDAAPVTKPVKAKPVIKQKNRNYGTGLHLPQTTKPKITYNGPGKGGGNNDKEDNGYKYQGNKPGLR